MPGRSVKVDTDRIKWEMSRRGWGNEHLAALIGMSGPGISRVLKGSTSPETFEAITAAFRDNPPLDGADALLAKKGE